MPRSALAETCEIHWRDRPLQRMKAAADIAQISVATLYRYASNGQIRLRRVGGLTMVDTASLVKLLDGAEEWTPSDKTRKAINARKQRAQASW